jgi:two-component system, chemotaxis family, protein-glutamate methylesterase/glutaminase
MAAERRTRILIVDDSAVMRSLLRAVVSTDSTLEVAGTAADGQSALQAMGTLGPDVVLLDIEMPVMDGLATLRKMRSGGNRAAVIMCSSLTHRGARVTIEALASGASDYVAKPAGQADRDAGIRSLAQELIPKIKALMPQAQQPPPGCPRTKVAPPVAVRAGATALNVVAIGVSTGGPGALERVLPTLPGTFPLPVLIVQHMPEMFTELLAERLDTCCRLRVRESAEGDPVCPGWISIARGNWHMEVLAGAGPTAEPRIHLTQTALVNHCRPAVDVLFRSVAGVYGGGALAVVLTGMGSDGLEGCRLLRAAGSTVIAQDQATSIVWGMPGAVTGAGLADRVLPLDAIGPEIIRLAAGLGSRREPAVPQRSVE